MPLETVFVGEPSRCVIRWIYSVTMPYKIDQQGKKWCVVKDDGSGKTMGCHDSETKAKAQLSALYANEPAAEVESLFKDAMESVGDPANGRVW